VTGERALLLAFAAVALAGFAGGAAALDPPHDATQSIECSSCHTPHSAPGGTLTTVLGNANLCMSCHLPGGPATAFPFAAADQAVPAPGLPSGVTPHGTSHRWDSGPAGWVEKVAGNSSSGAVGSSGAFTGRYAKTYTITITTAGDVGAARFGWTATTPGGGSGTNVTTAPVVALDQGISATFANGTGSPSFVAGSQWRIYVRTDLVQPTNPEMALRLENGALMCSTCHNQHSQERTPFDPGAPGWGGPGTGEGRHFQRVDNDLGQMCVDCHAPRDVATSGGGSHPVGVTIPSGAYQAPASLPLDPGGRVACATCHQPHYATATDGSLARIAGNVALCSQCHTLADLTTPGVHFAVPEPNLLWPGGQYGSTYPAVTGAANEGSCKNCHSPHGWPDSASPSQDYPKLLVERPSELCFTCHDGSPADDVRPGFASTLWVTAPAGASDNPNLNTRHDVWRADHAVSGTDLTCADCHDPHTVGAVLVRPDPDPGDGRVPTAGASWPGSDLRSEWCLDCHDGSLPSGVTPPTVALTNIRDTYLSSDDHGTSNGSASLKSGYGWADDDIVPCTACHVEVHGSTNLFQLRTTIYSKDGTTPIPSDCGGTTVAVTNNNIRNTAIQGWCFCNTCHTGSMGSSRTNCFTSGCHVHGDRF